VLVLGQGGRDFVGNRKGEPKKKSRGEEKVAGDGPGRRQKVEKGERHLQKKKDLGSSY